MKICRGTLHGKSIQKKNPPHPDPLPEKGEGAFTSPLQGEGARQGADK